MPPAEAQLQVKGLGWQRDDQLPGINKFCPLLLRHNKFYPDLKKIHLLYICVCFCTALILLCLCFSSLEEPTPVNGHIQMEKAHLVSVIMCRFVAHISCVVA